MLKVTKEYKRWIKSKKDRSNNISFGGHVEYSRGQDWIQFCYVIRLKNIRVHRPHVIGFVADIFFFHSGERIQKYPDSLANSPDMCGRKPYPERKCCGFKNTRMRMDRAE